MYNSSQYYIFSYLIYEPIEVLIICTDPLGKEASAVISLEVVPDNSYILVQLLKLVTPISIIFTFLKKKADIYNVLCKKNYLHSLKVTA